ncbi:YciE/YciF ferroxidase family protein [Larkinella soli]|uniref:YciE/YciF ferroxidase family protein n=1 Tax=Larkinella soli TaxID=1770527 RepID=UPI001E5E1512|nr:ferritin-like domain-containing protein [Larkinella soli]
MNETDTSLRELFLSELRGIYYAEKQIADNLPDMAEAATTDVVRNAFEMHRAQTQDQIRRIEQIFSQLGVDADEKTCNAADGLIDDGDVVIAETDSGSLTRDAALIIAGQKVEHHEIAAYGSLHSLARLLGYHEAAQLIEQSLQEEKDTDKKLTEIAESFINERAKMESDTDSDNNTMRNRMRDTVGEGDYGNDMGNMGSSRSGVTGSGTEEYSESTRRTSGDTSYSGQYGNPSDDPANLRDDVGSTGNTGYGTGSGSSSSSTNWSDDRDSDAGNDYTRRTGSGSTGGSSSGI